MWWPRSERKMTTIRLFFVLFLLATAVACAPPKRYWGPLDTACTDTPCEGVPTQCRPGLFPKEAYVASKNAGWFSDNDSFLKKGSAPWAVQQPLPDYPRSQLVVPNPTGGMAVLRFLSRADGTVDRVCLHRLEGDAAFARNSTAVLRRWRLTEDFMKSAGSQPIVGEVEFVFRVARD
jgi:hypothetical protein